MLLLAVQLLIIALIACDWTGSVMAIARSVRTSLMRAIDFFTCITADTHALLPHRNLTSALLTAVGNMKPKFTACAKRCFAACADQAD